MSHHCRTKEPNPFSVLLLPVILACLLPVVIAGGCVLAFAGIRFVLSRRIGSDPDAFTLGDLLALPLVLLAAPLFLLARIRPKRRRDPWESCMRETTTAAEARRRRPSHPDLVDPRTPYGLPASHHEPVLVEANLGGPASPRIFLTPTEPPPVAKRLLIYGPDGRVLR